MRKLIFLSKVVTLACLLMGANSIYSPTSMAGGSPAVEEIALKIFHSEFVALTGQSALIRTIAGKRLLLDSRLFAAFAPKALENALLKIPKEGDLIREELVFVVDKLLPENPEDALRRYVGILATYGFNLEIISVKGQALALADLAEPSSEGLLAMAEPAKEEIALDEEMDPTGHVESETSPASLIRDPVALSEYVARVFNPLAIFESANYPLEKQVEAWLGRTAIAEIAEPALRNKYPDFEPQVRQAIASLDELDREVQKAYEKIEPDPQRLAEKVAKGDRETLRALRRASREIAEKTQRQNPKVDSAILCWAIIQRSASVKPGKIAEINRQGEVQAVARKISGGDKRVENADLFFQIGHFTTTAARYFGVMATRLTPTQVDDLLFETLVKQLKALYTDENTIRRHTRVLGKTASIGAGVVIVGGTVYFIGTESGWWHRWDWIHEQMDDFMKWLKSLTPEEIDRMLDQKPQPQTAPAPAK